MNYTLNSNNLENNNLEKKNNPESNNNKYFSIFLSTFIIIWVTSGILGFLMSLICLYYSGNTLYKIFGLLIASLLFGPLYWLYYINIDNYCMIKPLKRFSKK